MTYLKVPKEDFQKLFNLVNSNIEICRINKTIFNIKTELNNPSMSFDIHLELTGEYNELMSLIYKKIIENRSITSGISQLIGKVYEEIEAK